MQMQQNTIISIQSLVSYGYVGNSIASFAIRLHSIEVVVLPTVLLSTHAEDNIYYGQVISPELFGLLLKGVKEIDLSKASNYLITGYINTTELIGLSKEFISHWKHENPGAIYVFDPVFGDTRANGLYIDEHVAKYSVDHLLSLADILTPNHFELEFILGHSVTTKQELEQAICNNPVLKEKIVVVTGVVLQDTPEDILEVIIIKKAKVFRLQTNYVDLHAVGTGDLFTSVFTSQLSKGRDLVSACEITMRFVTQVLKNLKEKKQKQISSESIMKSLEILF